MKKTIGKFTLEEVVNTCKKCNDGTLNVDCPFIDIVIVNCLLASNEELEFGLSREIEVEE